MALRGLFGMLTFDDNGPVLTARKFGSEQFGGGSERPLAVVLQP